MAGILRDNLASQKLLRDSGESIFAARHQDVFKLQNPLPVGLQMFGNGPNTVSERVSSTELSVFFALTVLRGELSEFLPAYYLCANANSPSFFSKLTEFAPKLSEISLPKQYSRNSVLSASQMWGGGGGWSELFGENQKGTAGRGRRKRNVTTICDKRHDNFDSCVNLRHLMTISVSLIKIHKTP